MWYTMPMFHKHNWNLIDKTIIPPAVKGPVPTLDVSGMDAANVIWQYMDAYRQHVVLTFKCDCGKVKTETHS